MPTKAAEGYSKEVYLADALPAGTNAVGKLAANSGVDIGDVTLTAGTAQVGSVLQDRDVLTAVTLLASAAQTADGTDSDVTDATLETASALLLVLDVTAQSGTTPTIDVAIQAKIGSLYYNLARFAQRGATTTKTLLVVQRNLILATELALEADPSVGTGILVNNGAVWSSILRVKWDLGGVAPEYTFSCVAYPVK